MTPWDPRPCGAGQQAIVDGIPGAEEHVIRGSNHSTIFDSSEEHNRVVGRLLPASIRRAARSWPGRGLRDRAGSRRRAPMVGWRDLFAINFTFFLNPVMMRARSARGGRGGLPLSWAVVATMVGQSLAYVASVIAGSRGSTTGCRARSRCARRSASWVRAGSARPTASSPRPTGSRHRLSPRVRAPGVALGSPTYGPARPDGARDRRRARGARGPRLRRDAVVLRVVLPLSLAFTGVLRLAVPRPPTTPASPTSSFFDSPDQQFTWTGFATFVTVACGSSLTLVANIADFCRYTPTAARHADRPRRPRRCSRSP